MNVRGSTAIARAKGVFINNAWSDASSGVVIDIEQIRNNCAGWSNDEIAKVVGWLVKSIATITQRS